MANIAKLVGILSKRVSDLEEKNGLLLEIIVLQNQAIKSAKAISTGLNANTAAADICINDIIKAALPKQEADKEAAE